MQSFVVHMILNALEEIDEDTVDENGDPVPSRTDFVDSYKPILECSTAGSTKQLLDHYLNNEKMCCANIPLSTCMAIQTGKLKWTDLNQPEAFSLLALFHLPATATSSFTLSGEEEARLHLKSMEGLGLWDADIAKATKILLVAPTNADMLAKTLGVMTCVLSTILGEAAPLLKATTQWVDNIGEHKMTYNNMTRASPAFPLQLACLINKRIQLYLQACNKASSPDDVSEVDLSFQLT